MQFVVEWSIDIEADTPLEAAAEAFRIMQKPGTLANVFDVVSTDGIRHHIDLEEEIDNDVS